MLGYPEGLEAQAFDPLRDFSDILRLYCCRHKDTDIHTLSSF